MLFAKEVAVGRRGRIGRGDISIPVKPPGQVGRLERLDATVERRASR